MRTTNPTVQNTKTLEFPAPLPPPTSAVQSTQPNLKLKIQLTSEDNLRRPLRQAIPIIGRSGSLHSKTEPIMARTSGFAFNEFKNTPKARA